MRSGTRTAHPVVVTRPSPLGQDVYRFITRTATSSTPGGQRRGPSVLAGDGPVTVLVRPAAHMLRWKFVSD